MRFHQTDTIAAISTTVGDGGIGIVRISGEGALEVAEKVLQPRVKRSLADRKSHSMFLANVVDPADGTIVDEALVALMRAPHTYTREDIVEIHCHGGVMAVKKALNLVLAAGARVAEPGEFTKRAFLNGRIDLAQAEAVIDAIRSRTESALKAAANQLEGGLSKSIGAIAEVLAGVLTQVEAAVDFSDEDIETMPAAELAATLKSAKAQLDALLDTALRGRMLKEGVRAVIVGRPNVGKSSLLNALLRKERAIVTPIPGTTRDVIEEAISIGGIPVLLKDTAGIRECDDHIERIGVELSKKEMEAADVVLCVIDGSDELNGEDREIIDVLDGRAAILVINKADLPRAQSVSALGASRFAARVELSALTGAGIDRLERIIEELLCAGEVAAPGNTVVTSARHEQLLERAAREALEAADLLDRGQPEEIVAMLIRDALSDLGEITGETVGEDVLGRIFSQFCIGK